MKKKKILLFGGSGLLGTRIKELLSKEYDLDFPSREKLNLVNKTEIDRYFETNRNDIVVYSAGITNQDLAESQPILAEQINSISAGWVAQNSLKNNIPMVYFSTDAVFNGKKKSAQYQESDKISPVNVYGKTKSEGESKVLDTSNKNTVIRLISIYTANYQRKIDFVRRILSNLNDNRNIVGIVDQYSNPTFSDTAVIALKKIIEKEIHGVIHIGSSDYTSNYQFTTEIAKTFGYNENLIQGITFKDFFRKSSLKRGQFAWLNVSKAIELLGSNVIGGNMQNLEKMKLQLQITNNFNVK